MNKILLINTGGTFNKVYNELNGKLEIPSNNLAIEKIVNTSFRGNLNITIKGIIYKDSLDMTDDDRDLLIKEVKDFDKVVIVHGTDTMNVTAKYLSKYLSDKTVVLTGAMKPFSIEPIEATSNLTASLNFLQNCHIHDIFIGMHGLVEKHQNIKKNRTIGKFELSTEI